MTLISLYPTNCVYTNTITFSSHPYVNYVLVLAGLGSGWQEEGLWGEVQIYILLIGNFLLFIYYVRNLTL